MDLRSYLKYTLGIFVGIIALYWIQFNLLPIPDAQTGLNIADFGLIGGIAFWIERTYKFIRASFSKSNNIEVKEKSKKKVVAESNDKVVSESNDKDGEQVVRNFASVILIILAIMLLVNIVSL